MTFTDQELEVIKLALECVTTRDFLSTKEQHDIAEELLNRVDNTPRVHEPKYWSDFMIDGAESYQGHTLIVEGVKYTVGDIAEYIRDYGWDNYSQITGRLGELTANHLLIAE